MAKTKCQNTVKNHKCQTMLKQWNKVQINIMMIKRHHTVQNHNIGQTPTVD